MIKKQKYHFDFVRGVCIPEIDLRIESVEVTAGLRPIRVQWNPELVQDLQAYHNIDAEQELTDLLSQQITAEIDREILMGLEDLTTINDPIQPNRERLLTPNEVRIRDIRQETIDKWSRLGFLNGLEGNLREDIFRLYEGQVNTLINEEPVYGGFDNVVFPAVRRVYSQLIANDIIPVQPLNAPPPIEFITPNLFEEQEEYEVQWRTEDTWSYENLYGSLIGISITLKPHEFIPKPKSAFHF